MKSSVDLGPSGNEFCTINETIQHVLKILSCIRINLVVDEYRLQEMIADLLQKAQIEYKKEYRLGQRNRIDFLVNGTIGIEIKKGKPDKAQVVKQLERYTSFDEVKAVILVVERNVNIPDEVNGKKCILFGLNRLWGVALK